MEDDKENLAAILTREEGKTLAESRGELQRSINVAEFCAGEARRLNGETIQSEVVKQDGDWWIGWIKEIPGVRRVIGKP